MRMNLARTIHSNNLNAQWYDVYRSEGEFAEGGWVEIIQSPPSFLMHGIIVPASAKELKMVPEADRPEAAMMFWSSVEIYTTRNGTTEGTSDKILWQNEYYRILQVNPYVDYGFWSAMGVRIKGA